MAASLSKSDPSAAGIWQKALDSITPEKAKSPADALKRRLARNRFVRGLRDADPSMIKHAIPEIKDRPLGNKAVLIPGEHINRFGEKLVRGMVYVSEHRYIEPEQEVAVSLLQRGDDAEVLQLLQQFGEIYEREPGIRVRKAVAHDAKTNAIFVFDIWDQFRLYGYVMDRDL